MSKGAKSTADLYFSKVVRARGACERCGSAGPLDCAHILRRRFVGDPDGVALRHNEDNAWALCRECHGKVDGDPVAFANLVHQTIGLDKYEELLDVRRATHRQWRESDWVRERSRLLAILKESV
jgi:hypothetical protein